MAELKRARAEAALDDVSDHLGIVLRRADELLAQWSAFGVSVRGQVEREAATIGEAVAGAVDTAVARATASGIDRAITDQVGARLTALTGELARLEARTRSAARAIADDKAGDRKLLWGVIGGIALANGLLLAILLRPVPATAPARAEPEKLEAAPPPSAPAQVAPPGGEPATASDPSDPGVAPAPVHENAPRPEPSNPVPGVRPVAAPASGTLPPSAASGAAAKLPPRAHLPKR